MTPVESSKSNLNNSNASITVSPDAVISKVAQMSLSELDSSGGSKERGAGAICRKVLSLEPVAAPSQKTPKISIVAAAAGAKLTAEEKEIFKEMVVSWHLSGNLCLLDFIGLDIHAHFEQIKSASQKVQEGIGVIQGDFFLYYFRTYCSMMLDAQQDPELLSLAGCPKFFNTPDECASLFARLKNSILNSRRTIESAVGGTGSKQVIRMRLKAYETIFKSLEKLGSKMDIVSKLAQEPLTRPLFIDACLNQFSEGASLEKPSQNRFLHLQQYCAFLESLSTHLVEEGILVFKGAMFKSFEAFFRKGGTKRADVQESCNLHARFSGLLAAAAIPYNLGMQRLELDPSFSHRQFCQERGIRPVEEHGRKDFRAYLHYADLTVSIFGNWIEDVQDIYLRKLAGGSGDYRPLIVYINRINLSLGALEILLAEERKPPSQNISIFEEFSLYVKEGLQKTFGADFSALEEINFVAIGQCLNEALSCRVEMVRLMMILSPFLKAAPRFLDSLAKIPQFEASISSFVRSAQKESRWPEIPREELKAALVKTLKSEMMPYAMMAMVCVDIQALFAGQLAGDIDHLLNDDFVSLCTLSDFDEIFPPKVEKLPDDAGLKPPAIVVIPPLAAVEQRDQAQSHPLRSDRDDIKQPLPKQAKPLPSSLPRVKGDVIPSKREFMAATKKRFILEMLEEAGFIVQKKGGKEQGKGSHTVLKHPERGVVTTVPQSVEKAGLRSGIYKEAFGGFDEDAKE